MISGKKLKQIRLFRKLTQKELAIMSGLTDAAIRNYELGNRSPNKEQLRKIADDIYDAISIRNCIEAKKSKGSTSFNSVKEQLENIKKSNM